MKVRAARFKGQRVWAECEDGGDLRVVGGTITFTYSLGGAKGYRTLPGRIEAEDGSDPREVEAPAVDPIKADGTVAPGASPRSGAAAKSRAATPPAGVLQDPRAIHLWADGACSGNPGPCGAGTVLVIDGHPKEWSTWLGIATNNVGELWAVLQGLEAVPTPVQRDLVVHTDSQYAIGVLSKGWKAKANQELVGKLRDTLKAFPRVHWHWVRGHSGVALNERCDQLAREAIERRSSRIQEPRRPE